MIVVDGANVAYSERSPADQPKVANLVAMQAALEEKGCQPVFILDAALIHKVDDPEQLEGLLSQEAYRQAPAGTDADYFVLKIAADHQAQVVSNDQFVDFRVATSMTGSASARCRL